MITKENFDPIKVVPYVWKELALAGAASLVAVGVYQGWGVKDIALPFAPLATLGGALAIFLAFRSNTSFNRWWEASTLWQNIHTQSRILARLVVTFVDAHRHSPQYNAERAEAFKREMIYRQMAWANALRLQLRGQPPLDEVAPFLSDDDAQALSRAHNKPAFLMLRQGHGIYDAMADGTLQGFDSFQMEGALAQLAAQQSLCERLKHTPVPRQYDYFTRVCVGLFILLLPFCLLSLFGASGSVWLTIPLSIVLGFVFGIIERTGAVNEHPFENRITDVPLSAICRNIERDLRETLGETNLPPALLPQEGYLF